MERTKHLRLKTDKMQLIPISTNVGKDNLIYAQAIYNKLADLSRLTKLLDAYILDWLRHEFGLEKPERRTR